MLELIWLIPLLPLIGVAINGFFGRRMSLRTVGLIACGSVSATTWIILPDGSGDAPTIQAGIDQMSQQIGNSLRAVYEVAGLVRLPAVSDDPVEVVVQDLELGPHPDVAEAGLPAG